MKYRSFGRLPVNTSAIGFGALACRSRQLPAASAGLKTLADSSAGVRMHGGCSALALPSSRSRFGACGMPRSSAIFRK